MKPVTIHRIRLSKMQKVINVLAVASAAVSVAVVGSGLYVYVNKDAIIESVTEKALDSIGIGGIGGGGGGLPSSDLPLGTNDLASPETPQAAAPDFAGENAAVGGPTL